MTTPAAPRNFRAPGLASAAATATAGRPRRQMPERSRSDEENWKAIAGMQARKKAPSPARMTAPEPASDFPIRPAGAMLNLMPSPRPMRPPIAPVITGMQQVQLQQNAVLPPLPSRG